MGFKQSYSVDDVMRQISICYSEASNFRNDGYVTVGCKKDLYTIKCFLDNLYEQLPKTGQEETWEQERVVQILKK